MITRRDFLWRSAAGAALLGWPGLLRAAEAGDPVAAEFRAALAREPWLLAFASAEREAYDAEAEWVSGKLPEGLHGTLYRNGPAGHELFGRRYQHWFDGDGLVQAWRLGEGGVRHRARFVETAKRRAERAAGRPLVPGFGTHWPDLEPPGSPAETNAANISVISHAGRLLALWEAADAYALDPDSLATEGPHHWSPETRGMPFSAHPRLEPDGTLWNFGSAPWAKALALYRIGASGKLETVSMIPLEAPAYVHDFVVTERHVVFLLPPLFFEPDPTKGSFLEQHRWRGDAPARLLVVDKADPERRRWLEMPACFVFHFGNAWEERDGTIRLDACRYDDARVMFEEQREVMWGRAVGNARPRATQLVLEPGGRVREERGESVVEFPKVDPRFGGRRYRHVFSLAQEQGGARYRYPIFDTVERRDLESGEREGWRYPEGLIPEEHVFVPRGPGAHEGEGWLLGSALDIERRASQLAVFDAQALAAGPVAVARLPYPLPYGLHGCFQAA